MRGWIGKILRVDLESEGFVIEDLDLRIAKDFIGGQGIAVRGS